MMNKMVIESLQGITVLILVMGMCDAQTANLIGPKSVTEGSDTIFTCNITGIQPPLTFVWNDISVTPSQQIFVNWEPFSENKKYDNFKVIRSGNSSSVMTIVKTELEDEGSFVCVVSGVDSQTIEFTVEDSPWFGHYRSFIVIAALAVLLVASIIINITQFIK